MKRQPPRPLQPKTADAATSSSTTQNVRTMSKEASRSVSVPTRRSTESNVLSPRKQILRRRRTASIGSIEDALQCPICKGRLKSPRIMPCQHTFCMQCLKNLLVISNKRYGKLTCPVCNATFEARVPDNLPPNLYVEALINAMTNAIIKIKEKVPKNTVSFAPLPPRLRDYEELLPTLKCRSCGEICENRCKHCKRGFCDVCWTDHVNDLKEELDNIDGDLETTAARFEDRINKFRSRANEIRDFVNRDIEAKIFQLNKRREARIKKVEHIIATGEVSVEDIKRRMQTAQTEVKEKKDVSYNVLPDNEQKVRTFLDLQQKAAEVMAAVTIWELDLNNVEMGLLKVNEHGGAFIKENVGPLYKRKTFAPKIIASRDMVQRPSALAVDTWRDHIIATCPGSGQVVILDRKFKLTRRIRHHEMMAPRGVAFLQENDEIYVTDKWKHCIFVFNHKGKLVRRMCSKGQGESQLRSPEGIAFHPERHVLYIADTGNDRIQVLEKDGAYLNSIGPTGKHGRGTAVRFHRTEPIPSQLNQPTDVAVTITRIVIADSGSHKVKVFDHDGQILQSIGGAGISKGLFKSPEVLRIDKKGNIIVGDAGNGRVQIFSPEGVFLRVLGAKGVKERQFGWVSGVLVTNNYDIFVSDSRNNVIYLY